MPQAGPYDQEVRLLRLLEGFDWGLAKDYLIRLNQMKTLVESDGALARRMPVLDWRESMETYGPEYFRVKFDSPLYLVLSHPISRFMSKPEYTVWREEGAFCTQLAIVPLFITNLNMYSVFKQWREGATLFFDPTAHPIPGEGEGQAHWKVVPGSDGAQYSSMNFILRYDSKPLVNSETMAQISMDYITYFFWSFKKPGFACSPHILHDDRQVRTVFKIAKSVYSIQEIYDEEIYRAKGNIHTKKAVLWGIQKEGTEFATVKTTAVLVREVHDELMRADPYNIFINGVVPEFRRPSKDLTFDTLSIIAQLGVSGLDLVRTLIGIVVSDRFESGKSLSRFGTLESLQTQVTALLRQISAHLRLGHTVADGIADQFTFAFKSLSPIVTTDKDGFVRYLHPQALCALDQAGVLERALENRDALVSVTDVLQRIDSGTPAGKDEAEFWGIRHGALVRSLAAAIPVINFAKTMKRVF